MNKVTNKDIVFIRGLEVQTVIGIFDWERKIKQTVCLDIDMLADVSKASLSDHIDDALDYNALSIRLIAFIASSEFQLIETLAEKICALILEEFNTSWVKLKLSKPGAIKEAKEVGVLIERVKKA